MFEKTKINSIKFLITNSNNFGAPNKNENKLKNFIKKTKILTTATIFFNKKILTI